MIKGIFFIFIIKLIIYFNNNFNKNLINNYAIIVKI